LGDIHACFTDNLLVFIDRIPNKLNLFWSLIVENHLINSLVPITRN
jgi:hypothetical protein